MMTLVEVVVPVYSVPMVECDDRVRVTRKLAGIVSYNTYHACIGTISSAVSVLR